MTTQKIDEHVYLTASGLQKLKEEYNSLVKEDRPRMVRRLSNAREQGDLSENHDYKEAREALNMLDGRIEELEEVLAQAVVVKSTNHNVDQVVLGSRVQVEMSGKTIYYRLVGDWEADPLEQKVSYKSPLGQQLFGKKVGDQVEVTAPAGKLVYKIMAIEPPAV